MKVLIVSDTHGQDENLEETVLREAPFDYLIHWQSAHVRLSQEIMTFLQTFPMRKRLLWRDIRYWLHMDIIILSPGIMINLLRMRRLRDVRLQCMVILTCL